MPPRYPVTPPESSRIFQRALELLTSAAPESDAELLELCRREQRQLKLASGPTSNTSEPATLGGNRPPSVQMVEPTTVSHVGIHGSSVSSVTSHKNATSSSNKGTTHTRLISPLKGVSRGGRQDRSKRRTTR